MFKNKLCAERSTQAGSSHVYQTNNQIPLQMGHNLLILNTGGHEQQSEPEKEC